MTPEQEKVREFQIASGRKPPERPMFIDDSKMHKLRIDLIHEEFEELKEAIENKDLVKVADAIGDLMYVVLGTANAFGIDMQPIFNSIHESNMTKDFHPNSEDKIHSKVIKGKNYRPPNIEAILQAQINDYVQLD